MIWLIPKPLLISAPMATEIIKRVTDDLDGSADAQPIRFGYQGRNYTIDLAEKNRDKLAKALAPYLEKGVRTDSVADTATRAKRGTATPKVISEDTYARRWAKSVGIDAGERGKVKPEIKSKWVEAGSPQVST